MPPRVDGRSYIHPGGMTVREIAAVLGVSRGTISNIEKAALKKLRRDGSLLDLYRLASQRDVCHRLTRTSLKLPSD